MRGRLYYVLDKNGEPVAVDDALAWARMFEQPEVRRVAANTVDDFWVSTVFLGLDHNWSGKGGPVVWETMIFQNDQRHVIANAGGAGVVFLLGEKEHPLDDFQRRCSGSREQALTMHAHTVQHAQEWLRQDTTTRRWRRALSRHACRFIRLWHRIKAFRETLAARKR